MGGWVGVWALWLCFIVCFVSFAAYRSWEIFNQLLPHVNYAMLF